MKLLDIPAGDLKTKLDGYITSDARYRAVYEYTKKTFEEATHLPAHNWAHAYRDTLNAIVIGEAEGADMHIVLPAITMHDIGFLYGADGRAHGAIGAEKVAAYLQEVGAHYSQEQVNAIKSCIRTHKGSMHNENPCLLYTSDAADE